jgi:ribosomal-protein-alanine N-acetyltransferase
MPVDVKTLTDGDIAATLEIERICFPRPLFFEDISRFVREGYALAAWEDDKMLGYVVADKILDECHIERIAVHPLMRRRGIGEKLLGALIDGAKDHGGRKIYLEVRETNFPSRALYTKMGFVESYVRKGYYSDNNEDAVVMEKIL